MKKIFTLLILITLSTLNAQVIIGDAIGTAAVKTGVLLEFAAGKNKGIIVPYVRTLPTSTALVGGAIILDATTSTAARIKYYNGTEWIDLSGQDADLSGPSGALAAQPTGITETGAKAIIGAQSSTADGVLVLQSTTKAMVLPQVLDVQNIPNPSPGMLVYINKQGAKRLAVFNGSKWSYWKP